jgi:hypothetical protein
MGLNLCKLESAILQEKILNTKILTGDSPRTGKELLVKLKTPMTPL